MSQLNLLTRHLNNSLPFSATIKSRFATFPKTIGQNVGKKRFRLAVENDVNKLITHCCGANYFNDGDEIKLKDDSEYPDWLWTIPLRPPKLHEYDPNTKEYWEKAAIVGRQRENKLSNLIKVLCFKNYII